jgi:hypothetical protein
MSWTDQPPNWQSPNGQKIDRFFAAVAERFPDFNDSIVIFGSATIHLRLDESFTSADADLRVNSQHIDAFKALSEEIGMGKSGKDEGKFYLDICPPMAFRSTADWWSRCYHETRHGLKIMIPQVRDVLVGKLHRHRKPGQTEMVPKDLKAFLHIRELTGGHPTEAELLEDILLCPHAWQLQLSGNASDFRYNLQDLWPLLYGHKLDVNEQILKPLIHDLERSGYTESRDWMELVRALKPTRP